MPYLYPMSTFNIKQYYFNNAGIIDKLSEPVRQALLSDVQQRRFKADKLIYREGKKPKGVYILRKGKVKIYQTGQTGEKQIMYVYTVGEMFGFRPIVCDENHPVSAVALEDCQCDFIPRVTFQKCVARHIELSNALLVSLGHEFSVWVNSISVYTRLPVRARVALGLLVLQEKFRTKGKGNEVSLSRSEFASYIGTVKEMVVRSVRDLREKKIVETQGSRIRILKPEELKAIVKFY